MLDMQFLSNSEPAPYNGVGCLHLPFNTFRLGRKWYDILAQAEDKRVRPLIDGEQSALILEATAWLLGPLEFLAERFGHDAHSWRASDKSQSPYAWFQARMAKAYGRTVGPHSEVSVLFFRPTVHPMEIR